MHYTGLISMVKTSIPCFHHFGFKITQTSVFFDFMKTISDRNWYLKVHRNQCFINDQLLCGKCQLIYTEATECTALISVVKTSIKGCCHFDRFKFKQKLVFFNFLKTVSDENWHL